MNIAELKNIIKDGCGNKKTFDITATISTRIATVKGKSFIFDINDPALAYIGKPDLITLIHHTTLGEASFLHRTKQIDSESGEYYYEYRASIVTRTEHPHLADWVIELRNI